MSAINSGGSPGNLNWEYLRAGEYETSFFCNGYRYRVEKYEYGNEWKLYYIWYYDSARPRKWKHHSGYYKTKKEAQKVAYEHNLKPRKKFKYIGKVPDTLPLPLNYPYNAKNHLGHWMFCKIDSNGKPYGTRYPEYLDPATVGVEISELPEDHPARQPEDHPARQKKENA